VGGGFKSGLHNVLEPAIFNLPVLFSNEVKNSDEDEILLKNGCGILVQNRNGFYRDFRRLLSDRAWRDETGSKCRLVFESTLGTSQKIIQNILDK
jgi:3-deoxy-D-manno-octulosonic-acid transferase